MELPYGNGSGFIATLLLPAPELGLEGLIAHLATEKEAVDAGEPDSLELMIRLPRFRVEFGVDLTEGLGALGLGDLFSAKADLSGIGGAPGELMINSVLHKIFLDLNEGGTEAAAVTAMMAGGSMTRPTSLIFDRPFLLLIRDSASGTVLMAGAISDPR